MPTPLDVGIRGVPISRFGDLNQLPMIALKAPSPFSYLPIMGRTAAH